MDLRGMFRSIESHPVVAAIIFFVVVFVFYNMIKKPTGTASAPVPGAIPPGSYIDPVTGAITSLPTSFETYNQQFNAPAAVSSATAAATATATDTDHHVIVTPPPYHPPPPPPHPPPPPPPVPPPAYHGVLTVAGSRHPANIGPWIEGRIVTYQGVSYALNPGGSGRLWGYITSAAGHGQHVLMWDGSDY